MNFELLKGESWEPIDFSDVTKHTRMFKISNHGRLCAFNDKTMEWKLLKPSIVRGYLAYCFKFERSITKLIHRLVAEAFISRISQLQDYVIHLDYDKTNNHYDNLRWVTKETMFAHHKLNPNYATNRTRRITNSKLSEDDVLRLKQKLQTSSKPLYKIAEEFGITHTQLNRIRSGENWGHIKPGIDD